MVIVSAVVAGRLAAPAAVAAVVAVVVVVFTAAVLSVVAATAGDFVLPAPSTFINTLDPS